MTNELFSYLTVALILCYIPFACISDIRTRTFPFKCWLPLILVGMVSTFIYVSESPERNFYLLGLSLLLCVALFIMSMIGSIGGADFLFASFIIIFVQYNPFKFPRVFFALDFFWMLMLTTLCLPIIIWVYNYREGNLWGDEVIAKKPYTFVQMLTKFPRGVPFMLPISFAFIATLIMEVLL